MLQMIGGRAIVEGFLESLKYLLVCYKECNRKSATGLNLQNEIKRGRHYEIPRKLQASYKPSDDDCNPLFLFG